MHDHEPAFVYDFRSRFGLGISDLGTSVPWSEVTCLVLILLSDSSSWLCAAKLNWAHPIDPNWAVQAATYDLLAAVNSKRTPKPYPRPWDEARNKPKPRIRRDARDVLKRSRDGQIGFTDQTT